MVLHLMDAAEPEFARRVGSVPLQQLQSLLESAVRGSSAASDPAAASLAAAWDHRSILNMLVANQPALSALPGAHTPLTMVRGWARRCAVLAPECLSRVLMLLLPRPACGLLGACPPALAS